MRTTARPRRFRAAIVATALIGTLGLAACSPGQAVARLSGASSAPTPMPSATPVPTPVPTAPSVGAAPARVSIPAISIDEPLIDLGIQASGEMEAPANPDDVGWFAGGGRPGGVGPTVIAAHVNDGPGPGAFVRLNELVPGDTVDVTDINGQTLSYVVIEVADYAKAQFPTARVFGASLRDELRLVTCSGWDQAAGSYVKNRVVFAERVT